MYLLGHARFTSGLAGENSIFHFVDNRSIPLHKKFSFRVFPDGPVKIIFSKTRDQINKTITFNIDVDGTTVEEVGCNFDYSLNDAAAVLKLKSINDIEITITGSEINFEDRIIINGTFEDLNFIEFQSEQPASWIVQKSIFFKKCCKNNSFPFSFAFRCDWD